MLTHNQRMRIISSFIVVGISMVQLGFLTYLWTTYSKCAVRPIPGQEDDAKGRWWDNDGQMLAGTGMLYMLILSYMTTITYISTTANNPECIVLSFTANVVLSLMGIISGAILYLFQLPSFQVVCENKKDFLQDVLIGISIFIVYWTLILHQMHHFYVSRRALPVPRRLYNRSINTTNGSLELLDEEKGLSPLPDVVEMTEV